jgi:hypothetical protein
MERNKRPGGGSSADGREWIVKRGITGQRDRKATERIGRDDMGSGSHTPTTTRFGHHEKSLKTVIDDDEQWRTLLWSYSIESL